MSSPVRTDPQGGEPLATISDDRRRAIRLLCRNGNSTTISVPPEFMHAMNVYPGDRVELVFDREWRGFFVRTYREPSNAPATTEPGMLVGTNEVPPLP